MTYAIELWLLFTCALALCAVLRARCPGPLCSCSPVCALGVLCRVCGVRGHLAPVHRCALSVCCASCALSGATWLLVTCVLTRCAVLRVRCPEPLGSCSPVCSPGALCCVCDVGGHWAPVHRCACPSCVVVRVARCVCGVRGLSAPVRQCACSMCRAACAASGAAWLPFTGVLCWCVVLRVRCPGPLCSCALVCTLVVLCCACSVLGLLAPVHRCACSVSCVALVACCVCSVRPRVCMLPFCILVMTHCCVACAVSGASWLLFTGVLVRCVVWCVRCPRPFGSCSPVCPPGVCCVPCAVSWASWLLFTGVLCACLMCCVLCAVSWATWLLFTGVPVRCVAWCVWCGCGCVLACAIPTSLHFSSRPRVGAVGVLLLGSCVHS